MQKFIVIIMFFLAEHICAQNFPISSPDNNICGNIEVADKIYFTVYYKNAVLMQKCYVQLDIGNKVLGNHSKVSGKEYATINEIVHPLIPMNNAEIINNCNVLTLSFKQKFQIQFRAYNDGIAYRFITNEPGAIKVNNEVMHVQFANDCNAWISPTNSFRTSYESLYKYVDLDKNNSELTYLPVLIKANNNYKILISEADLFDYPCMFLKQDSSNTYNATFPKVPLEYGNEGDRSKKILKEADYIASTDGKRTFPWRFFVISNNDNDMVANEFVYKLTRPAAITNTSWIKPGQVIWDWFNQNHIYGVDFKSGRNQDTYKYYIDFASKNNVPYIIMDEGWAKSTLDPFHSNPDIDLPALIEYGKQKNVKIILWLTWLCVENNFDSIFKTFHDWGIGGMKIDFMNRSDQWMVNYYTRVAKAAAENNLIIDFHGAFKPAGLSKVYPNVLSHEGVPGMEQDMGHNPVVTPDNSVLLPFIRNAVGPMDYTPGAMITAHKEDFYGNGVNPMGIGTRAYQMSLYIVFQSGVQMVSDNPMNYIKNEECAQFIMGIPTSWDETKVLAAKAGEYVVIARRKDDKWYLGAITNSKARNIVVKTDFLNASKNYVLTAFEDGMNADIQAMDYKKVTSTIHANDTIIIRMARDGGYAAIIE